MMRMCLLLHHRRARGFTVVELLVAMAVFSVVLLVVTVGIMQISSVYYKGVTEANTQDTARNIVDTVAQAIQFSGGTVIGTPAAPTPNGSSYDFCVNNQEFSYRPGYQLVDGTLGTHQTNHSLVMRTVATCSSSGQNLGGAAVTGREMMSPHMRPATLVVKSLGNNLYQIRVRVVYGDDDLLRSPSGSAYGPAASDAACKGVSGRQFCAVSDISTVVGSRVK